MAFIWGGRGWLTNRALICDTESLLYGCDHVNSTRCRGWYQEFSDEGADSSDKGATLPLSGYYGC